MAADIRALFRAVRDEVRPPPLGSLVHDALWQGRRLRRRRRLLAGCGALVVAAALAAAGAVIAGAVMPIPEPANVTRPAGPSPQPSAGPAPGPAVR